MNLKEFLSDGGERMVAMILKDMEYPEYLKTRHWNAVKERCFREHGCRCFVCGITKGIEVHHVEYDRIGEELPEDVVPLCRAHHQLQHDILCSIAAEKANISK